MFGDTYSHIPDRIWRNILGISAVEKVYIYTYIYKYIGFLFIEMTGGSTLTRIFWIKRRWKKVKQTTFILSRTYYSLRIGVQTTKTVLYHSELVMLLIERSAHGTER